MSFNLFTNTKKFATSKENHLTEFFTAALVLSEKLRKNIINFLGKSSDFEIESQVTISKINSQTTFADFNGQPDMEIKLSDGRVIIFENKIDAPQTLDSEGEPQLERYLELPVDGLVYVRESWKNLDKKILKSNRYIRPPHGEDHFLWRDFYPLLEKVDEPLCQWVKEGFENEGYTPPPENIPPLYTPDGKYLKENQKEFAKYWKKTQAWAKRQGWKTGKSSYKDLRLHSHSEKPRIKISPSKNNSSEFSIQIDVPNSIEVKNFRTQLEENIDVEISVNFEQKTMKREAGDVEVIRVKTTLNKIIEGLEKPEEIEDALFRHVKGVLQII